MNDMNAPKTIYVHKNICDAVTEGEFSSSARLDKRWDGDIEYRLVDPNEPDPLERVRAEIEKMSHCGIMRSMDNTIRSNV